MVVRITLLALYTSVEATRFHSPHQDPSRNLLRKSLVTEELSGAKLVEQQARSSGKLASNASSSGQIAPPGIPMDDEVAWGYYGNDTGGWPNAANDYPYVEDPDAKNRSYMDMLYDIGGGTGASVGGPGDYLSDRALLRRMRYQDKTVMALLILAYMGSLLFSASLAYRSACNDSPVKYYADPRQYSLVTTEDEMTNFLETFNQPPKDVQLQVTGLLPMPALPEYVVDTAVTWLGARYRVAFSFALDLSPWVVRNSSSDNHREGAAAGIHEADLDELRTFLTSSSNDLAYLEVKKTVDWKDWEELATNIKTRIRQEGFRGVIHVQRSCEERVPVHKNKPWANFMHSRTTKVLLALSVFGYFLYSPYMWLRNRAFKVRCDYRVDVKIDNYWQLIAGKIGPMGFDANAENAAVTATRQ